MDIKITKKDLNKNFSYIVRGGYCEFQYLTRYAKKVGYARGVYGWNWDAFEIEASNGVSVAICTGYRDMTGKRIKGTKAFEDFAKGVMNDYNNYRNYDERMILLKDNMKRFADYVIANYEKGE